MFPVTSAPRGPRHDIARKALDLLPAKPSRVPSLSAYAYQRSVSLLPAFQARVAGAPEPARIALQGAGLAFFSRCEAVINISSCSGRDRVRWSLTRACYGHKDWAVPRRALRVLSININRDAAAMSSL
jgi:hypothetical protein